MRTTKQLAVLLVALSATTVPPFPGSVRVPRLARRCARIMVADYIMPIKYAMRFVRRFLLGGPDFRQLPISGMHQFNFGRFSKTRKVEIRPHRQTGFD